MRKLRYCISLSIVFLTTFLISFKDVLNAESSPDDLVKKEAAINNDFNAGETNNNNNTHKQSPIIFFKTPNFDFGNIYNGEKPEHVFTFENKGKADLEISKVESSCGCTAAILTNKTIPPGETGEIKTTFNSSSFHGKVTKSITVHSNDPKRSIYKLTISCTVTEVISANPRRINFASVYIGSEMNKTITVTSDSSFNITKITSSIPFLDVSIKEKNENEYTINVSLKDNHEIGRFNGSIFLETDNTIQPKVIIPVFGDITGDITIYPEKLYYGNIKKGSERTQKVFLKLNRENIKISGIKVVPDFLSVKIVEDYRNNNTQILIEVKLHENAAVGTLNGLLEINTDSKVQPVIKVPIAGEIT
ncbi:MAG: DUF1573 domain-containing protein [Candidatus Scalindua sp.]|nr:DUF1573 domain-containing protein [Candidatus Scalindua sp.]